MRDQLPYDLSQIASGAVRVAIAPGDITLPDGLPDVMDEIAPYALKSYGSGGSARAWREVGATTGPVQYSRNLAVSGINIQQEQTALLERVSEVTRTVAFPFAEVSPENLALFELEAVEVTGGGYSVVNIGSTDDLGFFRLALIGQLQEQQGLVTEGSGGPTRGRFVARVFPRVTVSAENAQVSMGEGDAWTFPTTLKVYPDPDADADATYGFWVVEDARTITVP